MEEDAPPFAVNDTPVAALQAPLHNPTKVGEKEERWGRRMGNKAPHSCVVFFFFFSCCGEPLGSLQIAYSPVTRASWIKQTSHAARGLGETFRRGDVVKVPLTTAARLPPLHSHLLRRPTSLPCVYEASYYACINSLTVSR